MDNWTIKVEVVNTETGEIEKKEFRALGMCQLTPEQRLLWKTTMGDRAITQMRIRVLQESSDKWTARVRS